MKSDNDKQTIEDKIYASAFYRMFSLEMKTPLDKDGELKNTLSEYTSRKLDTLKISETDLTKIQEEMKKTDEEVARKVAEAAAAKTENTAVAAPKKKK
jgi:predicted ATP-grasp superfamily ATP-dependent carboligase